MKAIQPQRRMVAEQAKRIEELVMESDPDRMSDEELVALEQVERDAGIPDQ
jgi:hypothetical protein